jgi:Ca-activated chloride channel homolog
MQPSAIADSFVRTSNDFRFASAVAAFSDVLRGGPDARGWDLFKIRVMAATATGFLGTAAERGELVQLIDRAIQLRP